MVDYGAAVSRAWGYAANAKRIAVLAAFMLAGALFVLVPIYMMFKSITSAAELLNVLMFVSTFAVSMLYVVLGIIIAALIFTFANLLFIHNYANQKSLSQSASAVKSVYLTFLAASIIVGAISFVAMAIPFVGFIIAIILGLMFFFLAQEIVVGRSGLSAGMSNSYKLFRKSWVDTIITLVLTAILGMIIIVIFAIPLMVAGFSTVASAQSTGFAAAVKGNLLVLAITGLIALAGAALTVLFTDSIKTDVYMQLKKRKK